MSDHRTKRQKLEDMANQTVSPNEAEVAKRKLVEDGMKTRGFSEEDIAKALGPNPYGDVLIAHVPDLGGWVPIWTSNHFGDDDGPHPLADAFRMGRKTSPKRIP